MQTSELNKHKKSILDDLERLSDSILNPNVNSVDELVDALENMRDLADYHIRSVEDKY